MQAAIITTRAPGNYYAKISARTSTCCFPFASTGTRKIAHRPDSWASAMRTLKCAHRSPFAVSLDAQTVRQAGRKTPDRLTLADNQSSPQNLLERSIASGRSRGARQTLCPILMAANSINYATSATSSAGASSKAKGFKNWRPQRSVRSISPSSASSHVAVHRSVMVLIWSAIICLAASSVSR
jgi:hypothetical protein